jgi:hypothetical protein
MYSENIDEQSRTPIRTKVKQNKTKISAYNDTEIPQFGYVDINCMYENMETPCRFYITSADGPAILGLQ